MKQIANLKPLAAKPRVLQRAIKVMTGNPQCKYTLVNLPKLARASNYAAAVYHSGQSGMRCVFLA